MTYFAQWYFANRKATDGPLQSRFGPQEAEDIALAAQRLTFDLVNPVQCVIPREDDQVWQLIHALDQGPVRVVVRAIGLHSVLAYAWNTDTNEVLCYDPGATRGLGRIIHVGGGDWVYMGPHETSFRNVCVDTDELDEAAFEDLYELWAERITCGVAISDVWGVSNANQVAAGNRLYFEIAATRGSAELCVALELLVTGPDGSVYESCNVDGDIAICPWDADQWIIGYPFDVPSAAAPGQYYVRASIKPAEAAWACVTGNPETPYHVYADTDWVPAFQVAEQIPGESSSEEHTEAPSVEPLALPCVPEVHASNKTYSNGIRLRWDCEGGGPADYYEVYWATRSDYRDSVLIATTYSNEYFHDSTELIPCDANYYLVRACNSAGCNPADIGLVRDWEVGRIERYPQRVEDLVVRLDEDSGHPVLTWSEREDADYYEVIRSLEPDGGPTLVRRSAAGFVDETALSGECVTYWYKVRAVNRCGVRTSATVGVDLAPAPSPPGNLGASSSRTSCGEVVLQWSDVPGATEYCVYRRTASDPSPPEKILITPAIEATDIPPASPDAYTYWVAACNDCGCSDMSTPVSATPEGAPHAPDVFLASDFLPARISLYWSAVPMASHYELLRVDLTTGREETIYSGPDLSYRDENVTACSGYEYKVRGVNECGEGATATANPAWLSEPPDAGRCGSLHATTNPDGTVTVRIANLGGCSESIFSSSERFEIFRDGEIVHDVVSRYFASPEERYAICTWIDEDVQSCQSYVYEFRACNGCGCGDFAPHPKRVTAVQELPAPADVVWSQGTTCNAVRLAWTPVEGAVRYEVESLDGLPTEWVDESEAEISVPAQGTEYRFTVRALSECFRSPASDVVTAITRSVPEESPRPELVLAPEGDAVAVWWDTIEGVLYYRVAISDVSSPGPFMIETLPIPPFQFFGGRSCFGVSFAVAACNDCGCGELSEASWIWLGRPPAPPEGLGGSRLSAGTANHRLYWDPVEGADAYELVCFFDDAGPPLEALVTQSTSHVVSVRSSACHLEFEVRAINACGVSDWARSEPITVRDAPQAPNDISASKGVYADLIRVSWLAMDGASTYKIYRMRSPEAVTEEHVVEMTTDHRYFDRDVEPGDEWYYSIAACNACGCSPQSAAVTGLAREGNTYVPETPKGLRTTSLSGGVLLDWEPAEGADSYEVLVDCPSCIYWEPQLHTSIMTTRFIDRMNECGFYAVAACNSSGCSEMSELVDGHRSGLPFGAPRNVTAEYRPGDGVLLSWDPISGATEYAVMRDGEFLVLHVTSTAYTDTDVHSGESHEYVIGNSDGVWWIESPCAFLQTGVWSSPVSIVIPVE